MRDVDTRTRSAVLFVDTFRDDPDGFRFTFAPRELDRYLTARMEYAPADLGLSFFVSLLPP